MSGASECRPTQADGERRGRPIRLCVTIMISFVNRNRVSSAATGIAACTVNPLETDSVLPGTSCGPGLSFFGASRLYDVPEGSDLRGTWTMLTGAAPMHWGSDVALPQLLRASGRSPDKDLIDHGSVCLTARGRSGSAEGMSRAGRSHTGPLPGVASATPTGGTTASSPEVPG